MTQNVHSMKVTFIVLLDKRSIGINNKQSWAFHTNMLYNFKIFQLQVKQMSKT